MIAIIGVEGESAKREQSDSTPRPEPTSTPESGQPVVEVRCSDDSAATGGVSDILQTAPVTPTESAQPGRVERLPKIRQTIARRMLESLHTTAQLTTVIEADVTGIARLRAAEKDDFKHRTGTKLSYLPFFVKATVEALNEHPLLNSTINDDATEIAYHDAVHLGIAVDSPKGLSCLSAQRPAHDHRADGHRDCAGRHSCPLRAASPPMP